MSEFPQVPKGEHVRITNLFENSYISISEEGLEILVIDLFTCECTYATLNDAWNLITYHACQNITLTEDGKPWGTNLIS